MKLPQNREGRGFHSVDIEDLSEWIEIIHSAQTFNSNLSAVGLCVKKKHLMSIGRTASKSQPCRNKAYFGIFLLFISII